MNIPELQEFFLVGGTNLSLQIGHRISIDLDLFSYQLFDSSQLRTILEQQFEDLDIMMQTENTLLCYIN
jgi:hypothetical protein